MPDLHSRNRSEKKAALSSFGFRALEVPRPVRVRSQIHDQAFQHERLDAYLPAQERAHAEFRIDPGHLNDITGREYGGIFHAEIFDVNGHWRKCQSESPDFELHSSFFLEVGDHLWPVAIHINECGANKNKR